MTPSTRQCLCCGQVEVDAPWARGRWVVVGLPGFDTVIRQWQRAPVYGNPQSREDRFSRVFGAGKPSEVTGRPIGLQEGVYAVWEA